MEGSCAQQPSTGEMKVELNPTSEKACEIVALETPSKDGSVEAEDEEWTVPVAGMVFDSVHSALEFYKGYGKRMGFRVSIRNSTLSLDETYQQVRLLVHEKGFLGARTQGKVQFLHHRKQGAKQKWH
ncbi:hypothetical protein SLA2020_207570 [Shorea laevis]